MKKFYLFLVYGAVLLTLTLSIKILGKLGADAKAVSFLNTGVELLIEQLRKYADETDQHHGLFELNQELDRLCQRLGIVRAS